MSERALWVNVLRRVIDDAEGYTSPLGDMPRKAREVISLDARRWLALPKYAEARQIVCDMAGVDPETLAAYVRDHGLHRGLQFEDVRAYAPRKTCPHCGAEVKAKRKWCSRRCRDLAGTLVLAMRLGA